MAEESTQVEQIPDVGHRSAVDRLGTGDAVSHSALTLVEPATGKVRGQHPDDRCPVSTGEITQGMA
jgi:hypothetical protein